jgi:hypothetical protein
MGVWQARQRKTISGGSAVAGVYWAGIGRRKARLYLFLT